MAFVDSKLPFMHRVSKNIQQLAEQARSSLLSREDVQKLRSVPWVTSTHPDLRKEFIHRYPVEEHNVWEAINKTLRDMPDEGFKLMPWVVREFKRGIPEEGKEPQHDVGINWRNESNSQDIIDQAVEWMQTARKQNIPMPDYMAKDFDMNKLSDWVYEMHQEHTKEEWEDSEPVKKFPDGSMIVRVGQDDLYKEGDLMGHCVADYANDVDSGKCTIYSLRDAKGNPHATIEVSGRPHENNDENFNIVQIKGKQNAAPIPEYKSLIDEWLNDDIAPRYNITYGDHPDEYQEPEEEWIPHTEGPITLETPEDIEEYHDIMHDRWRQENDFGVDQEPEIEGNTWYYQHPRQLQLPGGDAAGQHLVPVLDQYMNQLADNREPNEDEEEYTGDDVTKFVKGLWLATHHYRVQNYSGPDVGKGEWNYLVTRAEQNLQSLSSPQVPAPARAPQLFDANPYNAPAKPNPLLKSMVNYMEELKNAPEKYEQPMTRPLRESYRDPDTGREQQRYVTDENGKTMYEPYTQERTRWFPDEGGQVTPWADYFNAIGMPGVHMPGTIAHLIRIAHSTDWNFHPGEYDGEIECPVCGHELKIQFHGGAVCPRCGGSFEVADGGIVTPSDDSVEEMSKTWPDTIPWGESGNEYYRNARTVQLRQHTAINANDFGIPPDRPYPFLYEPKSGWLAWGNQGGNHDKLHDQLARQGQQAPEGTYHGRWYPSDNAVRVYDPAWSWVPNQPKHHELIRRNAPQEALGDAWSNPEATDNEDWTPDLSDLY